MYCCPTTEEILMSSSPTKEILTCYVFKSRLQEYAQKAGLPTPVFYTTKEGPPHDPSFNSSVEVGGITYNSLPGFSTRKAAEQSASEVAITSLLHSGQIDHSFSQAVHEIGLCKNILQEYAQKMNYAVPTYTCQKNGSSRPSLTYSCTLEIGGIRYVGAAAKTKKEAEIKAARTALLTIQSAGGLGLRAPIGVDNDRRLTVVPAKRKRVEPPVKTPKKKKRKRNCKKKIWCRKLKEGERGRREKGSTAEDSHQKVRTGECSGAAGVPPEAA